MVNSNKAVFLDRDGVLVKSFVKKGKAYAPIRFKAHGFMTIVVTNQPDVGKKLISEETLRKMHTVLKKKTKISKIYTCIHTSEQKCKCRKPMSGMLIEAAKVDQINLKKSYMIGDRSMDILCGSRVGCKTIFINRNYKEKKHTKQIESVRNLMEATKCIINKLEK
jgi:D-glycero-D-manno-heptose 1,7-bisphosphate phosphatase